MADAPPLTVITTPAKDTSDAILKSCAALMWSTPEFEWAFDINKGDALCKTEDANITDSRADDSEVQTALQVRTAYIQAHRIASTLTRYFNLGLFIQLTQPYPCDNPHPATPTNNPQCRATEKAA